MCNALLAHVAAEFFAFVPQEYAFAAHNVASLTVRSSSESLFIYSCDYLLTTSKKRPTNCFTYLLLYLQMTRDKWSTYVTHARSTHAHVKPRHKGRQVKAIKAYWQIRH